MSGLAQGDRPQGLPYALAGLSGGFSSHRLPASPRPLGRLAGFRGRGGDRALRIAAAQPGADRVLPGHDPRDGAARFSGIFHTTAGCLATILIAGRRPRVVTAALLCLALGDAAAAWSGRPGAIIASGLAKVRRGQPRVPAGLPGSQFGGWDGIFARGRHGLRGHSCGAIAHHKVLQRQLVDARGCGRCGRGFWRSLSRQTCLLAYIGLGSEASGRPMLAWPILIEMYTLWASRYQLRLSVKFVRQSIALGLSSP